MVLMQSDIKQLFPKLLTAKPRFDVKAQYNSKPRFGYLVVKSKVTSCAMCRANDVMMSDWNIGLDDVMSVVGSGLVHIAYSASCWLFNIYIFIFTTVPVINLKDVENFSGSSAS